MVKLSSVGHGAEKENEKLQVRILFKQGYHRLRRVEYECCKGQNRKSKNDSRTLVDKPIVLAKFSSIWLLVIFGQTPNLTLGSVWPFPQT